MTVEGQNRQSESGIFGIIEVGFTTGRGHSVSIAPKIR